MKKVFRAAACLTVVMWWVGPSANAQTNKQKPQPGQTQSGPTEVTDQVPKFNMDYFVGDWQFEWIVPDSPLGEGGPITGTESIRKLMDGRFYEITIKGEAQEGPYTGNGMIAYLDTPAGQYAIRYEFTRGIALLEPGVLGGDLGGNYSHFWETPPFQHNGKTIKLKGRSYFTSPAAYRVNVEISIDAAAYQSLGAMFYTKQSGGKTSSSTNRP